MNKYILVLAITLTSLSNLCAQQWETDFETAKSIAAKENKSIVMAFEGSDWCPPCKKLNRTIWSSTQFQKLAKDHFVMLKIDFPRKKENRLTSEQQEHNNKLAKKYKPKKGFPYIVVLNSKGKPLGNIGFERSYSPEKYFNTLKAFGK